MQSVNIVIASFYSTNQHWIPCSLMTNPIQISYGQLMLVNHLNSSKFHPKIARLKDQFRPLVDNLSLKEYRRKPKTYVYYNSRAYVIKDISNNLMPTGSVEEKSFVHAQTKDFLKHRSHKGNDTRCPKTKWFNKGAKTLEELDIVDTAK